LKIKVQAEFLGDAYSKDIANADYIQSSLLILNDFKKVEMDFRAVGSFHFVSMDFSPFIEKTSGLHREL
jgi:hypothetical protein